MMTVQESWLSWWLVLTPPGIFPILPTPASPGVTPPTRMAGNSAPGTRPPSESSLKRRPTKPLPERIKWFVRIPWFGVMLVIWGVLDVSAPFLNLGCLRDVLLICLTVFCHDMSCLLALQHWKKAERSTKLTAHAIHMRDWYSKWSFWITSESLRSALLKKLFICKCWMMLACKTTAGLIIIWFNCFICGLSSAEFRSSYIFT